MWKFLVDAFNKDEDVDKFMLFGSPLPILVVIPAYLLFVLKIGPEFMKNRKSFELKPILIVYNVIQVIISLSVAIPAFHHMYRVGYFHDTCLFNVPKYRTLCISTCHVYLFSKYTELLDTVFFILRKKNNQVTFLHVYHHASMIVLVYLISKFALSDKYVYLGALNSLAHVVMYTYYALAAMGPKLAKYLWWKKYITKIQMTTFVLMVLELSIKEYLSPCPRHSLIYVITIWELIVNYLLFSKFYQKTYSKKTQRTTKRKEGSGNHVKVL